MSTASEGLAVRGVPLAGEALATWGLRPAQFQSKCRRRYQEGCCRAQGQDPRPRQHSRRRQIDVFGDQSSRFSDSVLHPPQHCRCRPRSYRWRAGASMRELTAHAGARRPTRERDVGRRRSAREYWPSRQYLYVLVFIAPSREMPAAFSLRASLAYRNINLIVSMDSVRRPQRRHTTANGVLRVSSSKVLL